MSDRPPPSAAYFIPEEIIPDILWHLPIKSLLRFRSVCKHWRFLISPEFVRSQPLRSISTSGEKVIFSTKPLSSPIEHSISNQFVHLDCPFIEPQHYVQVLGTCNGFVCLKVSKSQRRHLVIFSPYSGNFKHLPPVPKPMMCISLAMDIGRDDFDSFGGFAYDPSIDDYKVVLISRRLADDSPKQVRVLQLRESTSNWRITGKYSDGFFAESNTFDLSGRTPSGVFLNGALHWVGGKWDRGDQCGWRMGLIVSFHLAEEVVTKMELPEIYSQPHGLAVLGGYLCVFRRCGPAFEIWAMLEYGLKASWTRLYDIPYADLKRMPTRCPYYLVPVCFLSSGELLMVMHGERKRSRRFIKAIETMLVAYNLGNGVVRIIFSDGHHDTRVAVLDAEDGVPPNSHSESVFLCSDDGPESGEVHSSPQGSGHLTGMSTATPGPSNI